MPKWLLDGLKKAFRDKDKGHIKAYTKLWLDIVKERAKNGENC